MIFYSPQPWMIIGLHMSIAALTSNFAKLCKHRDFENLYYIILLPLTSC